MGKDCCQGKAEDLKALVHSQARVLWIVLIINLVMFFVEFYSSWISHSVALAGDSLDMLGDTLAYASSLYVVHLTLRSKAKAALFKASLMILLGLVVLGQSIYRILHQTQPSFEWMSGIGLLALAANLLCLALLTRHKNDDINFRSVWVCSRNDIIANASVIFAGGMVWMLQSPWPDLVIGLGITLLFIGSALPILRESRLEIR